jgi:hypothetical protein
MAWQYHVYLKTPGQTHVRVRHTFYGTSKDECLTFFAEHQSVCGSFGPAVKEGRFDDEWEEIDRDEIPVIEPDDEEDEEAER